MPTLKLTFFDSPQIELDGERIALKTRKTLALFVYIVLTPHPHSRDSLAALFWSEFSSERAFANLRDALRALTQPLGDSWFDIRRHEVVLKQNPLLWVDVLDFQQQLAFGSDHAHASDAACAKCVSPLLAAIDLYRDA
jgi:DNA-binding SARP family transcriptional activator